MVAHRRVLLLILTVAVLAATVPKVSWAKKKSAPITLTLSADRTQYGPGEIIPLSLTFENTSEHTLRWFWPAVSQMKLSVSWTGPGSGGTQKLRPTLLSTTGCPQLTTDARLGRYGVKPLFPGGVLTRSWNVAYGGPSLSRVLILQCSSSKRALEVWDFSRGGTYTLTLSAKYLDKTFGSDQPWPTALKSKPLTITLQ